MSISIDSPDRKRLAEVRSISVSGLPGLGSYTLVIGLYFSILPPKTDTYFKNVSIRLDWGDNTQRMIGLAIPEEAQPIRISVHNNEKTLYFRLALSPSQMEAIEARRNGGNLEFNIWMTGEVVQGDKTQTVQQSETFKVQQQEWVEALERMEYRCTLLFEVPLPDPEDNKEPAAQIIHKAQHHLLRGHYDECVGECRKLLEAYKLSDEEQSLLKHARTKYRGTDEQRKSMDVPERMAVLRDVITHATHLAHHHSPSCGYSRDQAKAILGATVAIISCEGMARSEDKVL